MPWKTFIAFVLATTIALHPVTAWGESAREPLQLTPKSLTLDGRDGDWFPAEQSERLLLRLESVERMEALLRAQEHLIETQKTAIKTASTALARKDDLIAAERARGDEFREQFIKERDRNESVWRSPMLWLGIGAAGTALISVVIFLLARGGDVTIVER